MTHDDIPRIVARNNRYAATAGTIDGDGYMFNVKSDQRGRGERVLEFNMMAGSVGIDAAILGTDFRSVTDPSIYAYSIYKPALLALAKQFDAERAFAYPNANGAWAAIGDIILSSSQMVDSSALPGPFTHVSYATILKDCIINVGINGAALMGRGGGTQIEYMAGPLFDFKQLENKVWMNRVATA